MSSPHSLTSVEGFLGGKRLFVYRSLCPGWHPTLQALGRPAWWGRSWGGEQLGVLSHTHPSWTGSARQLAGATQSLTRPSLQSGISAIPDFKFILGFVLHFWTKISNEWGVECTVLPLLPNRWSVLLLCLKKQFSFMELQLSFWKKSDLVSRTLNTAFSLLSQLLP